MSNVQLTFDAMCNMLMSITEESLLRDIERDCTSVSNAMLSIPFMIPGTRYYKGIKVRWTTLERNTRTRINKYPFGMILQTKSLKPLKINIKKKKKKKLRNEHLVIVNQQYFLIFNFKFSDTNRICQSRHVKGSWKPLER